jgi:hypothetical protein
VETVSTGLLEREAMSREQNNHKAYLGDGVYVETRGCDLVLTTSDGCRDTNTIYIEPAVWDNLIAYAQRAWKT